MKNRVSNSGGGRTQRTLRHWVVVGVAIATFGSSAVLLSGAVAGSAVQRNHVVRANTTTVPGTYVSGLAANLNTAHQDQQTSLCVEPTSGVAAPTGEPGPTSTTPTDPPVKWPTNVAASGCKNGAPTNPYLESPESSAIGAPAQWVGTSPAGAGADNYWTGTATGDLYDYDFDFSVPACTVDTITGKYAADNAAAVYQDGAFVAGQAGTGEFAPNFTYGPSSNFQTASTFSTTAQSGSHVIDFIVLDTSQPSTGLIYSLTITQAAATNSPQCGSIKICKVAGLGVRASGRDHFTISGTFGTETLLVDVGPAPGGYCAIVPGLFPVGSNVTIQETIPGGQVVSSILTDPSIGATNLATGTDVVTVGPGWNEVTYTDSSAKAGDLEICKTTEIYGTIVPKGLFTFTISGHPAQIVQVPGGACSPAIQVLAGRFIVTEAPLAPFVMKSCTTVPASSLISCHPPKAVIIVKPGGISNETVLTITNIYSKKKKTGK
jgi:molybdopterin-binding protein